MEKRIVALRSGVDPMGLKLGVWRLPSNSKNLTVEQKSKLKKANKFLAASQTRLRNLAAQGRTAEAGRLMEKLFQKSIIFHYYIARRACKGWYWKLSKEKFLREFHKYRKAVIRLKANLEIKRFYIEKSNGKMRPIGSPTLWSKMVLTSVEVLLREIIEPKIGKYQHGFMRGRGTQTASREVIRNLKERKEVFQFDLAQCFNRINYRLVSGRINSLCKGWGNYILNLTLRTFPENGGQREEAEIFELHGKLVRRGFTQGSPLSPLLSLYGLEWGGMGKIEGITMYADDGIVFRDDRSDDILAELNSPTARVSGVKIAEDKNTGWTEKFTYLGLNYDTIQGTVSYGGIKGSYYDEKFVEQIIKYSNYEKKGTGKWEVEEKSWLEEKYGFMATLKRGLGKWGWGTIYEFPKLVRHYLSGEMEVYYEIESESTDSQIWLMENYRDKRLLRCKRKITNYKGLPIVYKWNAGIKTGTKEWYWMNETWGGLSDTTKMLEHLFKSGTIKAVESK